MDWNPNMDEAPRYGAFVGPRLLLFVPPYGAMSGHWDPDLESWRLHACFNREARPTHWMPLPEPPADQHYRKGEAA